MECIEPNTLKKVLIAKNKNVNIPYNIFIESVICEAQFYILYIKILLLKTSLL